MAKKKVGLTVDSEVMREARQKAIRENTSVSQICEDFLRLWISTDLTAKELIEKIKASISDD